MDAEHAGKLIKVNAKTGKSVHFLIVNRYRYPLRGSVDINMYKKPSRSFLKRLMSSLDQQVSKTTDHVRQAKRKTGEPPDRQADKQSLRQTCW